MKKITIVLLSIALSFMLMSCGKKNNAEVNTAKTSNSASQTAETKEEDITTSNFDKELIDNLIKESDYISRLRLQTSTAEGVNPSFINDYKGDLSKISVEIPKTLSPNKEYIVFYKDNQDGEVVPTEREGSFIEINGEKDTNLTYIDKKFGTKETK